MTSSDEDHILTRLNQFCEVIGGVCQELGIYYGGVNDDHVEIVEAIKELKQLKNLNN